MAEKSKFIQSAIKRPGALTQKAKAAHMSDFAFAEKHKHDSGTTGSESRFYLNVLRKSSKKK